MPLRRSFDVTWPLRFARFIRAQKVDVVQSHEFTANVYATAGARLAGVPVVCTTHGKNYWPFARYRRMAYRWTARNADAFIAVSTDLGAFVSGTLGIPGGKVSVIRNGIDTDGFSRNPVTRARTRSALGMGDGQVLLLACGELAEVKGHEVLLRALPGILAAHPEVRLVIAGDGPLRSHLEALSRQLGVAAHTGFLGFRRDVPDLLNAADLFVMPSLSEGLPLAVLEAMAAEVPVVATAVGGIPELIHHGRTGWLVPPGDSAALAAGLSDALANGAVANADIAAAAARLCGERYALSATVNAYADCYRRAARQ